MNRMIRFAILSMSCFVFLSGCSSDNPEKKEANNKVESVRKTKLNEFDFNLVDIKGKKHQLIDYQGKPLVVKYWASWCPICLAGLDEIEELSADKTKDYQLITIVTPDYKNEKKSSDFIEWFNTLDAENSVVLLDKEGKLAKKLGIRAYPSFVYYDSKGEMIQTIPGHAESETIEGNVSEI